MRSKAVGFFYPPLFAAGFDWNHQHVAEPQDDPSARARLARLIEDRRKSLSLSISGAARAAGIDRGTWTAAERGTRQTEEYMYAGIERVLRWAPGSIDDIMAGGEPTIQQPAEATEPARPAETPGPLPDDEAIIKVMRSDRIPEDQKRRIVRILIDDRERERQRRIALADDLIRDYEQTG